MAFADAELLQCVFLRWLSPVTCLTQVLCRGIPGAGGVAEAFPGTSLLCSPFTVSEHNYLVLNKLNEEKKR
jgi:hypothetical protein